MSSDVYSNMNKLVKDILTKEIEERGINLSWLSRCTNISYMNLYDSFKNKKRNRTLKASEFIIICQELGIEDLTMFKKTKPSA